MVRRFVFVFAAAMVIFGCSAPGLLGSPNEGERENGVISVNVVGSEKTVSSFQADVTIIRKDNRSVHGFKKVAQYKLSSKIIDGVFKSRMEIYDNDNRIMARVVQGATEMVSVDNSGSIMGRMALPATNALDELMNTRSTFRITGRMANFSTLRARATRLNFDTVEDSSNHCLTVSVPVSLVSTSQYKVKSYKLKFDTISETLSGSETVAVESNGSSTTIKTTEVYREFDGLTYHVGRITDIDRHVPQTNSLSGGYPTALTDPSTVPEVTKEEIERIRKEGGQVLELDPILGDPASLDTSETIQEAYLDIQVNPELDDADFSAAK